MWSCEGKWLQASYVSGFNFHSNNVILVDLTNIELVFVNDSNFCLIYSPYSFNRSKYVGCSSHVLTFALFEMDRRSLELSTICYLLYRTPFVRSICELKIFYPKFFHPTVCSAPSSGTLTEFRVHTTSRLHRYGSKIKLVFANHSIFVHFLWSPRTCLLKGRIMICE